MKALWRGPLRGAVGRRLAAAATSLLPVALGLALQFANSAPVEWTRNLLFDEYQRLAPRSYDPDAPVRVIDIDNDSLTRIGQWPWPRSVLAELTRKLGASGAAVIAFDAVFSEEDRLSPARMLEALPALPERDALASAIRAKGLTGDGVWASAIASAPVVLGLVLSPDAGPPDIPAKWGMTWQGDPPAMFLPHFNRAIVPLPDLAKAATGLGSFNFAPEHDLVVRKLPLLLSVGPSESPALAPSLVAEALRVAQGASTYQIKSSNASGESAFGQATGIVSLKVGDAVIPTDADGGMRVHFAGTQAARHIPAWKVLADAVPRSDIDGRILFVGASAAVIEDLRASPLEAAIPGVDIHAEAMENILAQERLTRPDYANGLESVALLAGGIAAAFIARRLRPAPSAALVSVMLLAAVAASWFAFTRAGMLLDPLVPGFTWFAAYSVSTVAVFRRTERERRSVRDAFARYVAPAVVAQLAADPDRLKLGGEARELSILFSDVRGFTSRAESMSAAGVIDFLNALHTPFTQEILATGGTIDKFLGDGIMAFWNAPLDVADHASCACRAALAMQAILPEIDRRLAAQAMREGREHNPVQIGIGITTGAAFVGNMGSEQRFDYSIVGDPVNTAARLEAATKTLAVPVLVNESTRAAARDFLFVPLGAMSLKGKSAPTPVYALHGPKSAESPDFKAFLQLHGEFVAAAQSRYGSLDVLASHLARMPDAAPYLAYYKGMIAERDAEKDAENPSI